MKKSVRTQKVFKRSKAESLGMGSGEGWGNEARKDGGARQTELNGSPAEKTDRQMWSWARQPHRSSGERWTTASLTVAVDREQLTMVKISGPIV